MPDELRRPRRADLNRSVWLVGLRPDEAIRFEHRLVRRVGCAVTIMPSFETARVALADHAPDVLVTPVGMGAYNGIHVAVGARVGANSVMASVIIDDPEAHHELSARLAQSHYLVRPVRSGELAGLIGRIVLGSTQLRMTRRTRVRRDVVLSLEGIDGSRVLEFSDGGMRLAVPTETSSRLPSIFGVAVGEYDVTVRQAWHRVKVASTHFGLLVYQESPSCAQHWRGLRASFGRDLP